MSWRLDALSGEGRVQEGREEGITGERGREELERGFMAAGCCSPPMARTFWASCAVLICLVVATQAGIPDRGSTSLPLFSVHGSSCAVVLQPWPDTFLPSAPAPQATSWCKTADSGSTVGLSFLLAATHGISSRCVSLLAQGASLLGAPSRLFQCYYSAHEAP